MIFDRPDPTAFGDRHLRADPQGKLADAPAFPNATVRLLISEAAARTRVGQLGAWQAVNLLARLDGLVAEIDLVCPEVAPHETLALLRLPSETVHGRALLPTLRAELELLALRVSGGRAHVRAAAEHVADAVAGNVPVELIIGGAETQRVSAAHTVWCFGRGWLAFAGSRSERVMPELRNEPNPLGMFFAVCYGVGEVFKVLRGLKDGTAAIEAIYSSLWSGENAASWEELVDGPSIHHLKLPATYLVGAGAVGQAAMLAMVTSVAGAEFVTTMDRETFDDKNRNRYVLAFKDHGEADKAEHVASLLRAAGTRAHGEALHWMPYVVRESRHPEPALAELEADFRYRLVLSCVDENLPRHEIQNVWPCDLFGGSTESLRAMAAYYDLRTDTACLACHNPVQKFEHRVAELREDLAGLAEDGQRDRLIDLGFAEGEIPAVIEYLRRPKCGELAEEALQRYTDRGPPRFAVGFVSVAAGLLLARHWIRFALEGPAGTTPEGKHYLSVNFVNGRMLWTEQLRRADCPICATGRATWRELWVDRGGSTERPAEPAVA